MATYIAPLLLLTAVIGAVTGSSYTRVNDCKERSIKIYDYTISGEIHDQRGKEQTVTAAKVHLFCESEGIFNGENVNLYRIALKSVIAKTFEIKNNNAGVIGMAQKKYLKSKSDMTTMMNQYFSFLRNERGSVVKVFFLPGERSDVVNFKKTIASAFQLNFDGTRTRKEIDTQSKHTAHYKYDKNSNGTVQHKTVDGKDVTKFSGNTRKKGVDFHSEEDIAIGKDHTVRQSHGKSTTSLTKEDKKEERVSGRNADIPPIETKSVYTLKLISEVPSVGSKYSTLQQYDMEVVAQDDLLAQENDREHDIVNMKELHNELPDLKETASRAARSVADDTTAAEALLKWKELLYLESKYGALNWGKPKLITIIENLNKIWFDKSDVSYHLRLMLYNLLGSEGSVQAQQALMKALKLKQFEDDEYEAIVMAITLLPTIEHSTLLEYKTYVLANKTVDEQLLLSLATLGRHRNVEEEVINTILIEGQGADNTETLIHFIHALGNTGSRLMIPYLIPLLLDSDVNIDIQLAAIDALRTVSTDERVHRIFNDYINPLAVDTESVTINTVLAIVESLQFPYESNLYYPEEPESQENDEIWNELLMNIVNITIEFNDEGLYNVTVSFLKAVETNVSSSLLNDLQSIHNHTTVNKRTKRSYTTDWGRHSAVYNLIASRSSRLSDKKNYRFHKAFLWGKKLGPSKIHLKLAAGGFAGIGVRGYKIFGKAVAQFYCYGRKFNILKAEYLSQYSFKTKISKVRRYAKVLGMTYKPHLAMASSKVTLPYNQTWRKTFRSLTIFYFRFKIFIWIGFLRLYIRGDVNIGAKLSIRMTMAGAKCDLRIGPTFVVRGGASIKLLIVFRVGLEIKASIGYYINPRASVTLCDTAPKADASACFGIFHGSRGLNVGLYAYFQKLSCKIRLWPPRIRCRWTGKRRLRLFSSRIRIRSLSMRLLWGRCLACSNSLLHQYCLASQVSSNTASTAIQGSIGYCRSVRYQ